MRIVDFVKNNFSCDSEEIIYFDARSQLDRKYLKVYQEGLQKDPQLDKQTILLEKGLGDLEFDNDPLGKCHFFIAGQLDPATNELQSISILGVNATYDGLGKVASLNHYSIDEEGQEQETIDRIIREGQIPTKNLKLRHNLKQTELKNSVVDDLKKLLKKGTKIYGYHLVPNLFNFWEDVKTTIKNQKNDDNFSFDIIELAPEIEVDKSAKLSNSLDTVIHLYQKYEEFVSAQSKQRPYSSHVFILPFYINHGEYFCEGNIDEEEWDRRPLSNEEAVEQQSYFKTNYLLDPKDSRKFQKMIQYAFERYFNAEVLEVLKEYTKTYVKKKTENQYYQIKRYLNGEGTEVEIYQLKINYINLRLISTGGKLEKPDIGFLIISADNNDYFDNKTINRINQFGRRVYAPFFSTCHTFEEHAYDICISDNPLEIGKRSEPTSGKKSTDFTIMTAIDRLLRSFFCFKDEDKILENIDKDKNELSLQRILDDRMFVVSNYRFADSDFNCLSDGFKGDEFKDYHSNSYLTKKQIYDFQKELYKYIYIDNGYPSSQSPISVREQLNHSVYDRWMDSGTLYAVSQHSMLMLTTPEPPTYLFTYFYTEYLEMLLLVLTQRVGILSFSMEAGKLAKVARDKNDKIGGDTLSLQERYVVFKNQFLLPELSSQEQTIEMYDLLQQNLYIHRQKEMLDDQIQSLYEINQTKSNNIRERENAKFNLILFFFTVWTFIASYNDFRTSYQGDGEKVGPITWEDWISRPQPDLWTFYRLLLAIIIILILCKMLKKFPGFLKNAIQKARKWYKEFLYFCYRCLKRLLTYFENRICDKRGRK